MKPPICYVCQNRNGGEAQLVSFADYRPLDAGICGHPHGLEWFCEAHSNRAKEFSNLPIEEAALRILGKDKSWWRKITPEVLKKRFNKP